MTQAKGPSPKAEITEGWAFFQARLMPLADANVNVTTHALNYGTGCFEGIRAYWNEEKGQLFVMKLREHYERFLRSMAMLRMEHPYTVDQLCDVTVELLQKNGYRQDTYIRPLAFKASRVIKVALSGLRDEVAIFAVPMGDYVSTSGLRATVSAWQRVSDNAIPSRSKTTGSYVNAALAIDQATRDGYDEAIMLNSSGHVAETSSANLFLVRQGQLVTTPVTADILEGVTRTSVFAMAEHLGIPVEVREIDRTELYVADEMFVCGTGAQVAPITSVDGRPIGRGVVGPISERLQRLYFNAARGDEPAFRHWVTPVDLA